MSKYAIQEAKKLIKRLRSPTHSGWHFSTTLTKIFRIRTNTPRRTKGSESASIAYFQLKNVRT